MISQVACRFVTMFTIDLSSLGAQENIAFCFPYMLHKHKEPTCCIVKAVVACSKCCVICQLRLDFQDLHIIV